MQFFLIGMLMGAADLIPGISGGTVAFVTGIYERWLSSIQTLQFHAWRRIDWKFLLPLAAGMLIALGLGASLLSTLLYHFGAQLRGLFFGIILATAFLCSKRAHLKRPSHWLPLLFAALLVAKLPLLESDSFGALWVVLGGALAAFAMLLPGISGSYVLHCLGMYTVALHALSHPSSLESLRFLALLAMGVALGLVLFSRIVSWLLSNLSSWTSAALVGFMGGGLPSLLPQGVSSLLSAIIGFSIVILLNLRAKKIDQPKII